MVTERMRDLARLATGAGRLDGAEVRSGRAEHPVCGDELELDLRLVDGRITALSWRAAGCPATMAVAACLEEAWCGATPAQAPDRLRQRLAELGGLSRHEAHAERIALRALDAALGAGGSA